MEEKVEAQDHDRSDSEDKEGMHMADEPHRDLEMGKVASESEASDSASTEDINPELTQVATGNSVPTSVLSHPTSGGALGRAVTGPKNKSVDEEGRIVVNWASGTDPENPKNWPRRKKIFNVVVISSMTFLCPLCSSMFSPGLPQIMEDFQTSQTLAAFSVSVFLLGFGSGPLILAPLSETFGRKPIYIVGFTIFTLTQIPCALSKSISMLIGFRFLQGFFGSASIANGGGTISDMYDALERTRVVGWYILGPLTGPAVGPIIGGFMTESLSWRWTFWLMLILSSVNTTTCILFLRETYAPVLLSRKAAKLQKETGQSHRPAMFDPTSLPHRIYRAIQRPLRILLLQPIVFVMAVYMALVYGTLYLLLTTFPIVYQHNYGFSPGLTGLTYLGIGLGFMLAILFGIPQIDKQYRRLTAKNNGVSMPEFRLPVANVGAVCIPISLLWYGWSVQAHTFFLVPIIGTVFFGIGTICIFNSTQNFYIDAFTRYAASAIAAGSLFRSLVGAAFPLFGSDMYTKLGYGWGCTILAGCGVLLMPMPMLIMTYGKRIRERFPVKL